MRRRVPILLAGALLLTGTGCTGERTTAADRAREAVVATSVQPRTYTYLDEAGDGGTSIVDVVVEDDFRYSADWSFDGRRVYREVVVDDAMAAQASDFELVLDRLGAKADLEVDPDAVAGLLETDLDTGQQVPVEVTDGLQDLVAELQSAAAGPVVPSSSLLRGGDWVVDEVGAPPLGVATALETLGQDPVRDAVAILDLVRSTINGAGDVVRWDDSSIEYRPDEDPFRPPTELDGQPEEVRYDVEPIDPPSRAQLTDPAAVVSVTAEALRVMAIYVKEGVVHEVRLRIDATPIHEQIESAFDLPTDGTEQERTARALEVVNQFRQTLGQPVIVPRDVTVTFSSVGDAQSIRLPDGAVGSLAFLDNRGSPEGRLPEPTSTSTSPP